MSYLLILTRKYSEKLWETAGKIDVVKGKVDSGKGKDVKPRVRRGGYERFNLDGVEIVLIAASTGGPTALEKVLKNCHRIYRCPYSLFSITTTNLYPDVGRYNR